jgi:hypothetical protein
MTFPWYELCNKNDISLEQGDFIPDCPVIVPPLNSTVDAEVDIQIINIDSIILSQSCDLGHGKIEIVLLCPYLPLSAWLDAFPKDQQSNRARERAVEKLRKGHFPGYHLLNKLEDALNDYQVVDFKNVNAVNYDFLIALIQDRENRVRLLPPYKEHLSQAFARYFMRVGLPQDLKIDLESIKKSKN